MTIEMSLLISGISLSFAIYTGIVNLKRNQSVDDKKDASDMTTVIVKLENIGAGIAELKSEIKNIRDDNEKIKERLIVVEQSVKQAHKRLDDISKRKLVELDE